MPVLLKLQPPAAFSVGFLVQDGAKQKAPFQPTHVCLLIRQGRRIHRGIHSMSGSFTTQTRLRSDDSPTLTALYVNPWALQ